MRTPRKWKKTEQNTKLRVRGDRNETVNYMISEWSKLELNECKTRHDWVGKMIRKELCNRLKFDHTTKRCMYKTRSVQENERNKFFWYFNIQTYRLILDRRRDRVVINKIKKNLPSNRFYSSNRTEKIKKKIDKYLNLSWELKTFGTWGWR